MSKDIKAIAKVHGIHIPSKVQVEDVSNPVDDHSCHSCNTHISIFTLYSIHTNAERCIIPLMPLKKEKRLTNRLVIRKQRKLLILNVQYQKNLKKLHFQSFLHHLLLMTYNLGVVCRHFTKFFYGRWVHC